MANENDPLAAADIDEQVEALERKEQVLQKIAELEQKNLEAAKGIASSVQTTVSSYTKITKTSDTVAGQMTRMLADSDGIGDAWSKVSKTIGETAKSLNELLSVSNILGSVMDLIVKNTLEFLTAQDDMAANFEKTVGNAAKFKGEIFSLYGGLNQYGISLDNAASAYTGLKEGMTDFENLSSTQRRTLGDTVAQLDKLGVNTKNLVDIQATLHKSMGMSVIQVSNLEKQLFATANAMGRPPKQIIDNFAQAAPKLAVYGKNMVDVFISLENSAKKTGLEINTLTTMANKFDTFESAAESVGNLNAMLGGDYFDTLKMINMNEAERVKYIEQQLKASGKSIDSLDRFQQKAIAQQLGLKDASQLQALYNNELGGAETKLMEQELAQKEMNKAMQSAVTLTDKLNGLWNQLGLIFGPMLEPIVPIIKNVVGEIGKFIKELTEWWNKTDGGAKRLRDQWNSFKDTVVGVWEKHIKPVVNKFLGFFGTDTESLYTAAKGGFDKIPDIIQNVKKSVSEIPEKLEKSFPFLGKIIRFFTEMWNGADSTTKKIVGIAGGFLAVKAGLGGLSWIFGSDDNSQVEKNKELTESMGEGGITGAISSIGTVMSSFKDVFIGFGAAIAGIGIGIGAAAAGLALMVDSLGKISDEKLNTIIGAVENIFANLGTGAATGTAGAVGFAGLVTWITGDGKAVNDWFYDFALSAVAVGISVGIAGWAISNVIDSLSGFFDSIGRFVSQEGSVDKLNNIINNLVNSFRKLVKGGGEGEEGVSLKEGIKGLVSSFAIGNIMSDLGKAAEKLGPVLDVFLKVSPENVTSFHKAFNQGTKDHLIPAFSVIFPLAESSAAAYGRFNTEFQKFENILQNIKNLGLDNLKTIREEIQNITAEESKFISVVKGFVSLADSLSSGGIATNLANGILELNQALFNFDSVKAQQITNLAGDPKSMEALKAANTITLEAKPGSPLEVLANALSSTEGVNISIMIDGEQVNKALTSNIDLRGILRKGLGISRE